MNPTELEKEEQQRRIWAAELTGTLKCPGCGWDGPCWSHDHDLPDPEHNRADAVALLEHARNEGWEVSIRTSKPLKHWCVVFGRPDRFNNYDGHDPDFCRAVTLAFLKLHQKLQ